MTVLTASQNSEQAEIEAAQASADAVGADEFAIADPLELVYKFIFDPKSDYREISKLWSLTYLSPADCAEILRLAKNIRIYDKEEFQIRTIEKRMTGNYEVVKYEDGTVEHRPIYQRFVVYRSRFEELIQKDLGRIQAICASAGGRSGALIRAFRTTGIQRHESLEEKTAPKAGIMSRIRGGQ